MNIVSPIPGHQRGIGEICVLLTHKENVATQAHEVGLRISPDDSELLLFCVIKGVAAVGTRRVGDNVNAFRGSVSENF